MKEKMTTVNVFLTVIFGIFILVIAQMLSTLPALLPISQGVAGVIYGLLYVALAYYGIKIVLDKIIGGLNPEDFYIGKILIKPVWGIVAVALPVIVSAVLLLLPGEMSVNDLGVGATVNIVLIALFVVGFGAGVVEEMIFRGLIMKAVEARFGKLIAIIVPSVLFGILHASSGMNVVDVIMLLLAGTSVGIMFSLIVYESGSIWSSAIVHGIWNIIMIGGILNISADYNETVLFSYELTSNSVLLTGGDFGVEASIISIIGYVVVIGLALFLLKKENKQILKKTA